MAQKKQLSFVRGEVSPAFRYKSSSVAYTEGLHKLKNGFTRRGGGVSNRPGFIHLFNFPDDGIRPKSTRSNTRLLSLDAQYSLDGDQFGDKEIWFLFLRSDRIQSIPRVISQAAPLSGSEDIFLLRTIARSTSPSRELLYQSSMTRLKEGWWFSFGGQESLLVDDDRTEYYKRRIGYRLPSGRVNDIARLRPSSRYLFPWEYLTSEIVDPYFYYGRSVGVYMESDTELIRGVKGAYVVTAVYEDGTEMLVCAMEGHTTGFTGSVRISLNIYAKSVAYSGGSVAVNRRVTLTDPSGVFDHSIMFNNSQYAAGPSNIDISPDSHTQYNPFDSYNQFPSRDTTEPYVGRPLYLKFRFSRADGLVFNLYRGANFHAPMNLVATTRVRKSENIVYEGLENGGVRNLGLSPISSGTGVPQLTGNAYITLRDGQRFLEQSGNIELTDAGGTGISSKSLPDNLRLYGPDEVKGVNYIFHRVGPEYWRRFLSKFIFT